MKRWPAIPALLIISVPTALATVTTVVNLRRGTLSTLVLALDTVPMISVCGVSALLVWRRPENFIGWILGALGFVGTLGTLLEALLRPPYSGFQLALKLVDGRIFLANFGLVAALFHKFPTGRAASPFWKNVGHVALVAFALAAVSFAFEPGPVDDEMPAGPANPLNPIAARGPAEAILGAVGDAAAPVFLITGLMGGIGSLVTRYRRGSREERLQIKWLAAAAGVVGTLLAAQATPLRDTVIPVEVMDPVLGLIFITLPVSIGFAVLRYRLYDIDVVINKTFVYFSLAAFITLIYVGVVVGIGSLIGSGDEPNLGLSLAATAVVAVAFQPVRERVQRLANRIVYGQRLSPYEAVTSFSHRMAESLSLDQVLPQMAEAAAKGVGGNRSQVKLLLPGGREQVVSWPTTSSGNSFDRTVTVSHQGERVGAISVAKAPGEQITKSEEKLLADLASQAGLAMRNLRLTAELQQKLVELQESRKRIVAAQDEERRRMERDIHDGAQQQLVSMAVKLGLARSLAQRDPEKAATLLDDLKGEAEEALETLRELARGLFPQVLIDRGLSAAVESFVEKLGMPVSVSSSLDASRLSLEVETAVYFVVREALQNASKHARGSPVEVSFSAGDGVLIFEVEDRGPGFDVSKAKMGSGLQNMADRMEALGGTLTVEARPGAGTTVAGSVSAGQR